MKVKKSMKGSCHWSDLPMQRKIISTLKFSESDSMCKLKNDFRNWNVQEKQINIRMVFFDLFTQDIDDSANFIDKEWSDENLTNDEYDLGNILHEVIKISIFFKFIAYNSQLYWCCNFARDRSNLWNLAKSEIKLRDGFVHKNTFNIIRRNSRLNSRRQFSNVERDTYTATDRLQEVDSIRVFCVKYKHVHWGTKRHCSPRPRNAKWDIQTSKWIQAIQSCPYIWLGDPPLYVCQALGALIRVSTCGSILGPFGVHFGGPFWVHFWVHFGDASSGFWVFN